MHIENKQSCPTCGQSVNKREIPLNSSLVSALMSVYQFCQEKNRHEFKRDEIDHLIPKGTPYANFGYWKWFGQGLVYTPDGRGRGYWGFNMERIGEFFAGKRTVYERVYKDPLQPKDKQIVGGKEIYIGEVPNIREFIDENREFIVRYMGTVPVTAPLPAPKRKLKKGQIPCPKCGWALKKRFNATPSPDDANTMIVEKWQECPYCRYSDRKT